MTKLNTQYEDMLRSILSSGSKKSDRTGTGTTSIFGYQTRFDLSKEFPLITTKKVFVRGAAEELFWFLRGSINSRELEDIGVNIWKDWADENGELGPVYGYVWRYAPTHSYNDMVQVPIKSDELDDFVDDYDGEREFFGVGYSDGAEGVVPMRVFEVWKQMLAYCYDESHPLYSEYGGKGVTVSPAWHSLARFASTLHMLPLYPLWKETPENFTLNYNYYGASKFSPNASIFLPFEVELDVVQDEEAVVFNDVVYASEHKARWILNGERAYGEDEGAYEFTTAVADEGMLWRPRVYVDQVETLMQDIKTNPDSRRLIISAWNPALTERQALPPCHTLFQFYVVDGKLSCQLYQRSMDAFLGCPFNYVGYSLFLHMLAQQTGLEVGEFIHSIGDAHIYDNHTEQIEEQLSRDVRPLPTIKLKKADSLYDYKFEDIEVIGYDPHPPIKAPVAV